MAGLAVALTLGAGAGVVAATRPGEPGTAPAVPVTVTVTAKAAPAPTVTVPAPPITSGRAAVATPADRFADGTYLVGSEIEAGSYRSPGPAPGGNGHCYWARLRPEATSKIVAGQLTTGAARFTARKGEYVQVAGCEFSRG
ncbi:hypothetical protein [Amycolatopsis decaplanina]|uniref:Uncharacterized protein n=1 Tax=Amycolatopsis decaplanina DSM 44594 TaxID=1284240 RepID=M2WYZ2_9PSEU|nr:hypothetical protein [Amycolatopsis decaplanina]EME53971.1 hypothetical protein H074_28528 [Amycolatopsis decaplanina DSM 44594]